MGLDISTVVDISTRIAAGGVPRLDFGQGLLITADDTLPAGGTGKAQRFSGIAEVNAVFDAGDLLDAALVWFGADPPPRSLYIGRWATADVPTTLQGGTPGAIADIAVLNAGFTIDETSITVNLAAATTYAAIATAIQRALTTGGVASVNVTAGGSGYTGVPTVAFTGGGGTGAAGTAVVAGQVVTGVTITSAGTGYATAPTITFTGGAGTGAAATAVLTSVSAALAGATFTYSIAGFLLTLTGADDIGVLSAPTTGTDISALLAMDAASANYRIGHDQEAVVDAVGEMIALATGGSPLPIMVDESVPDTLNTIDTREALAAYAQANNMFFGLRDTSDQVLVTNDPTSQGALAFDRQQDSVVALATKAGTFPDIALLAEMSAQNLNQPASIVSPHNKPLPGAETTTVTDSQLSELARKRVNVYTMVGGLPSLLEGYTSRAGYWLDAVWWLKWLQNELELNIFNAQRGSRRMNNAILSDVLFSVGQSGVRNGGLQPGKRVNASNKQDIILTTQNYNFDGVLTTGFLFWVEPTNERSDLDTENRIGRFKMWGVGSEVIHKVFGDIVFQN